MEYNNLEANLYVFIKVVTYLINFVYVFKIQGVFTVLYELTKRIMR